ncbi:MAG TPA: hypothetical protein PLH94_09680 [Fimbriimonadaceae bacterium]|nr:hypothetical protein [Fimbriimonadaceae bacterium]
MERAPLSVDRSKMELIGQLVEVRWVPGHPLAKQSSEESIYVVRGFESDMLGLALAYGKAEGSHPSNAVYWVNVLAVQYLRVLTEREAKHRIEQFEREFELSHPRD